MSDKNSAMEHLEVELSAYVSDELEETERQRVEEHLVSCRKCMEQLQRLQKLDVLLSDHEIEPGPDFLDTVLSRVDQERKVLALRSRKKIILFLAAALVAFFAFLLSLQKQTPAPSPVLVDKSPVQKSPQTPKQVSPPSAPRPEPVEDPELIAYLDELENMEVIRELDSLDNLDFAFVMGAAEVTE